MDEPFTDEVRTLLSLANQAAQRRKHEYIGTEHILLGLIEQGESVATKALKKLNVDPEKLRHDVERLCRPGPRVVQDRQLPQTPRAKKVIEYAVSQARHWRESRVSSGHILIGLLREEEGVAAQVLMNRGVTLESLWAAILELQGRDPSTPIPELPRQGLDRPSPEKGRSIQFPPPAGGRRLSYEHFTDRARKVIQLANREAQRLNHDYIGTEHVLLGLIEEVSGVGAAVLKNLGIDLLKIRSDVETLMQDGPDIVTKGKLPQAPRLKNVLEYAMEEAGNLNHDYVGTEHLLLSLLREQEGIAEQVLMNAGLGLQQVRDEIIRLLAAGIRSSNPPMASFSTWGAPIDDLPNDVKAVVDELDAEIDRLQRLKEEAVAAMDFERAAGLRDEADKLASQRRTAIRDWAARHPVDASWLSGGSGVLRLAQQISERRSWDELPKLADALEQAGCTDSEILSHCRASAKHIDRCWVVDLLLAAAK